MRKVRHPRHPAAGDEQESPAALAQDVQVVRLFRVQAEEHQPALVAQLAEEIEHEADVAVLRVELRLVEQMDLGAARGARSSMTDGTRLRNARTW